METGEIFLTPYGRAKEVVMGTLSRESELERVRIKLSRINIGLKMKTRQTESFQVLVDQWCCEEKCFLRIAIGNVWGVPS